MGGRTASLARLGCCQVSLETFAGLAGPHRHSQLPGHLFSTSYFFAKLSWFRKTPQISRRGDLLCIFLSSSRKRIDRSTRDDDVQGMRWWQSGAGRHPLNLSCDLFAIGTDDHRVKSNVKSAVTRRFKLD